MMRKQFNYTKKQCYFCKKKINEIDFKDATLLSRYLTPWAKIKAGHDSGVCAKHNRRLSEAIKRARYMAILPYVKR